jgi:hypothetical protein
VPAPSAGAAGALPISSSQGAGLASSLGGWQAAQQKYGQEGQENVQQEPRIQLLQAGSTFGAQEQQALQGDRPSGSPFGQAASPLLIPQAPESSLQHSRQNGRLQLGVGALPTTADMRSAAAAPALPACMMLQQAGQGSCLFGAPLAGPAAGRKESTQHSHGQAPHQEAAQQHSHQQVPGNMRFRLGAAGALYEQAKGGTRLPTLPPWQSQSRPEAQRSPYAAVATQLFSQQQQAATCLAAAGPFSAVLAACPDKGLLTCSLQEAREGCWGHLGVEDQLACEETVLGALVSRWGRSSTTSAADVLLLLEQGGSEVLGVYVPSRELGGGGSGGGSDLCGIACLVQLVLSAVRIADPRGELQQLAVKQQAGWLQHRAAACEVAAGAEALDNIAELLLFCEGCDDEMLEKLTVLQWMLYFPPCTRW